MLIEMIIDYEKAKKGQKVITGWPKSKFLILNDYNSETKHFWPHVGKAKMGLRGGSFFEKL